MTQYADAIRALGAAAAAFERAKGLGLVWTEEDGRLFAIEADMPASPPNPAQLQLTEGI